MDDLQAETLRPVIGFIWKVSKLYEKSCSLAGKPYGLTQNEIDVLLFLANNKGLNTAMDIARYRFISKSLVSKSVNSLVTKEYISAEKHSSDRRNTHLFIMPKAKNIVIDLQKAQSKLLAIIKDTITEEELYICLNVIKKASINMDNYL